MLNPLIAFTLMVAGILAILHGIRAIRPLWRSREARSTELSVATLVIMGGLGLIGLAQLLRLLLAINAKTG